jgi:hypothetical protein
VVYTEERLNSSDGGEPVIGRRWRRADGGGFAFVDDKGKLQVEIVPREIRDRIGSEGPTPGLLSGYKKLATLPTDPDALLRWGYDLAKDVTGAGLTEDGDVYAIFKGFLADNVLPPDLEAGFFRATKQIPGVTVETVDIFGRPTLSIGQTEDWLREELLLDPETYAVRGQRSTITKNTRINPLKAGNSTGEVKQGSRVVDERLVTAIVDEPGERP